MELEVKKLIYDLDQAANRNGVMDYGKGESPIRLEIFLHMIRAGGDPGQPRLSLIYPCRPGHSGRIQ